LDLDCDFNDYVGNRYCLLNDNVHQFYANWICINPGTTESLCLVELEEKMVEECGGGLTCDANEGMCVNI